MQIMEFIIGLEVGLVAGFLLRGMVHKLDFKIGRYGSEKKHTR